MTIAAVNPEVSKPELGLLFVLLVGMSVTVTAFLPAAFFDFWRQVVMAASATVGGICGVSVTSHADILTVDGFSMRVIDECTAFNYVIILSTAILFYTRHSIGYRMAGVLLSVPLVVLVNAFRLVITGITGAMSRRWFEIVHEYIWVAIFALLIFGIWKVWADRTFHFNRQTAVRSATILGGCSAMFALLSAIMPVYGPCLAYIASVVLKVLVRDNTAAIIFSGNKLQSISAGISYQIPFSLEYFNIAVFAGLALPLQRKGDWRTFASTVFGIVGAIVLNAALIATTIHIVMSQGEKSLASLLFIEKGFLLAVPFALWWIVGSQGERRGNAHHSGPGSPRISRSRKSRMESQPDRREEQRPDRGSPFGL